MVILYRILTYVVNLRGSEREKTLFAQDMQIALQEKDTYKKI